VPYPWGQHSNTLAKELIKDPEPTFVTIQVPYTLTYSIYSITDELGCASNSFRVSVMDGHQKSLVRYKRLSEEHSVAKLNPWIRVD
jgi:hypothetical protein